MYTNRGREREREKGKQRERAAKGGNDRVK